MPSVLFVCTHNSARSQMAEGLLRSMAGDAYDVSSAGTEPSRVHPMAVEAMREVGIDISTHVSESVDTYAERRFDYVVTVCDSAREACPFVPALVRAIHHSFEDPSAAVGSHATRLGAFRKVRDQIRDWLRDTFPDVTQA